jgi:hypothetical protein
LFFFQPEWRVEETRNKKCRHNNAKFQYVQFIAIQPISFGHSKVPKGESNNANTKSKYKDDAKAYESMNVDYSNEGKQKHVCWWSFLA